jgi:hypothetical protein
VLTGRAWDALPETAKLFYAQGMKDGLTLAAIWLPPEARDSVVERTQAKGFNPGDYVKELDKLFAESENRDIVLPLACQYVTAKLKGTSTAQELEQMLIGLRRSMAK